MELCTKSDWLNMAGLEFQGPNELYCAWAVSFKACRPLLVMKRPLVSLAGPQKQIGGSFGLNKSDSNTAVLQHIVWEKCICISPEKAAAYTAAPSESGMYQQIIAIRM